MCRKCGNPNSTTSNLQPRPGQTALHFAVDYGDEAVEVVEKLIAAGAKVDAANKFGVGLRSGQL